NRTVLAMTGLVLLAALILAGGVGWAVLEAARQHTNTTAEALPALAEVERWLARSKWPEARAALERARAVLASGRSPPHLAQLVPEWNRYLTLVDRLENIRLKRPRPKQEARRMEKEITRVHRDYSATDRAYAEAFRDFGLFDVDDLHPADAASRLR